MAVMQKLQTVKFSLGETEYSLNADNVGPETTLNDYLRKQVHLTGTKKMCAEGGCGACIVAVEEIVNKKKNIFVVNSCLVSILSCHGWKIHTIEGIGNPRIGLHPIQKLLADNNGSQCGFCSTGMVMNMFALNESGPKTMKEIENSFGGNICRCTGYRAIMEAFKKLGSDADKIADIEEFQPCLRNGCSKQCNKAGKNENLGNFCFELGKSKWMKVHTLKDLMEILRITSNSYMLVGGNTAKGVYRNDPLPNTYIDVTGVIELTNYTVDDNTLSLGGNLSLTKTMDIFQKISSEKKQFSYLSVLRNHIDLVATVPVRNIGTLAGNLMIKNKHKEFPSDVFLLLETFNATLVIVDVSNNEMLSTPKDFIGMNMNKKVIKSIVLNALSPENYKYLSYKIMPRAQNAHAMVNTGFLFEMEKNTVKTARIVYGGINPTFVHAENTEKMLKGRMLFDNKLLLRAFKSLDREIHPDHILPDPSPQYRKHLAISLFYKFILNTAPETAISARNKTGGAILQRPLSKGVQQFDTQKNEWPLTEPVIKVEARAQTSGQAQYIADIPDLPNQLFAAFVTAEAIAGSEIITIDASAALKLSGVVAFYDKSDIPGTNTYTPKIMGEAWCPIQEELLCSGRVQYYHQPIGIIVANDQDLAWKAAELVKASYSPPKTSPFLNMKEVVDDNIADRIHHETTFLPKGQGDDVKKVIKGEFYIGSQFHFHMEVQCCNVVPTEDGLDVYPSTQWMDLCQGAIYDALKIPMNRINVHVRRLGGAFGAKIMKNSFISTAAALAAVKLKAPVKMWIPLEKNMDIIGGRVPLYTKYEVGVNDKGVIQYLKADLYSDLGIGGNEYVYGFIMHLFENCYNIDNWEFSTYRVNTDNASTTWARAPGSLEGLAVITNIMEHIARTLNLDPMDVRLANLNAPKFPKILRYWEDMQTWADIATRKKAVQSYNQANRWKKRGMSVVPMLWTYDLYGQFNVLVTVFHGDGGVVVSHGGIEMGQGINTKVAQMCAYKFGLTLDRVVVKPSYNVIAGNCFFTGGSYTSESVCYAVSKACDDILARMKPVKDKMKNPTWTELVEQCFTNKVNLTSTGFIADNSPEVKSYPIYGLCATEVEVDILTGQKQILQVDIIEDLGESGSPLIDVGQVEGAFVMGIGYHTTEELIYNADGKLMTDRSWNYKPPGAKDIPINFRIKFPEHDPNKLGLLKSKAVAEPPICLSIAVPLAIRDALASARKDSDPNQPQWIPINGATTVEASFLLALNKYEQYIL